MESSSGSKRMESSFSEIPKSDVYYKLQQSEGKNHRNIFDWLGISPKPLEKHISGEDENDVFLYIQWGFTRASDDISHVRKVLLDYPKVTRTSTIYILAMATLDDAKKHKRECVISNWKTEGNITFVVFHCSYKGHIHDCAGNRDNKMSLLEGLKAKDVQLSRANTDERVRKTWKMYTTARTCMIVAIFVGLPVYISFIIDRLWTFLNSRLIL